MHFCHLLRTQHHCLCPNGRKNLPSACPPTPPFLPLSHPQTHPLINDTRDITGVARNIAKTSSKYCTAVSYETLAIRLLYLYRKSLAWLQCSTGEPQLLQYFKMAFLEIQNVRIRTIFVNPVTNEVLCLNATTRYLKHVLWLVWHHFCLPCQAFSMHCATKAATLLIEKVSYKETERKSLRLL